MVMKIALEEHFMIPELLDAWGRLDEPWSSDPAIRLAQTSRPAELMSDLGDSRVAAMDLQGIDVQVLSLCPAGVQVLPTSEALALQTVANDRLADVISGRPERFQGWAALAPQDPDRAAAELGRAVTTLGFKGAMLSRTLGKGLEEEQFWPIFEAAEALRVPLYIHPHSPAPSVIDAYYRVRDEMLTTALATGGIGWHYDTGIHILRCILAGVFDRFPDLQLITGHWGEVVLF